MIYTIWDDKSGQYFLGQEDMEWHPTVGMFFEKEGDATAKLATLKAAYPHRKLSIAEWYNEPPRPH